MARTTTHPSRTTVPVARRRSWLRSHHEGRLSYRSGCGDRSVVVSYALVGDEIVVRLPEYSPVFRYAVGAPASLTVDDDREPAVEPVTVRGTAHAGPPPSGPDVPETWPAGVATHDLYLPLDV